VPGVDHVIEQEYSAGRVTVQEFPWPSETVAVPVATGVVPTHGVTETPTGSGLYALVDP
jgi:hypothetical protein